MLSNLREDQSWSKRKDRIMRWCCHNAKPQPQGKTELLIWWMDNITPTRRIYVNSHPVSVCLFVLYFSSFDLIIMWQRNIMVGRLLPAKKRFSVLGHRGLLICRRFNNWGLGNCNLGIIAQIMSDLFFWLVRVLPFYAPPPIHKNVSRYLLRELEGESVVLTANCSKGEQKHSLLPPHRD